MEAIRPSYFALIKIKFKHKESEKDAKLLRFTERQATAILEMRLYRLIGLEIEALLKEHEQTMKNIAEYEKILGNRGVMAKVIIKELEGYRKAYGRERRTTIDNVAEAVIVEPKLEEILSTEAQVQEYVREHITLSI